MSIISLHIGRELDARPRDFETTGHWFVSKSRSPVSRSQKILQFNFEQLFSKKYKHEQTAISFEVAVCFMASA